MIVLQIYDYIPKELEYCIDSVKGYAKRVGAEYIHYNDLDDKYYIKQSWSNNIRMEYASANNYLLYADWDVFLEDDFNVSGNAPKFCNTIDSFFWTGNRKKLFEKWNNELKIYQERVPTATMEPARLWKIMKGDIITKNRFDKYTYKHLGFTSR